MTLSRTVTGLLLAAFAATPALAQSLADYRLPAPPLAPLSAERRDCPPTSSEDEIIVCGSRDDGRYRVPPSQRPPSAADRAGGEQMAALAAGSSRCSTVGPHVQCAGGLDFIGIAFTIVRAIARARANRD
jgi:hypothetical protein